MRVNNVYFYSNHKKTSFDASPSQLVQRIQTNDQFSFPLGSLARYVLKCVSKHRSLSRYIHLFPVREEDSFLENPTFLFPIVCGQAMQEPLEMSMVDLLVTHGQIIDKIYLLFFTPILYLFVLIENRSQTAHFLHFDYRG